MSSPPTTPDAPLVRAATAGDHAAFATLVTRYQRPALATCLAILRDRQLAEDAAQDAFVSAYQSLPSLRDPAAFGGWLLRIARHRATRLAKSRPRHQSPTTEPQTTDPPLADEPLLAALATLPDHERAVVLLRHFESHDVATIATLTNRPVGTVTKQLSRAHQRLRKLLEDQP